MRFRKPIVLATPLWLACAEDAAKQDLATDVIIQQCVGAKFPGLEPADALLKRPPQTQADIVDPQRPMVRRTITIDAGIWTEAWNDHLHLKDGTTMDAYMQACVQAKYPNVVVPPPSAPAPPSPKPVGPPVQPPPPAPAPSPAPSPPPASAPSATPPVRERSDQKPEVSNSNIQHHETDFNPPFHIALCVPRLRGSRHAGAGAGGAGAESL